MTLLALMLAAAGVGQTVPPLDVADLLRVARIELRDPRSIEDLQVCEPTSVKLDREGFPKRWTYLVAFNSGGVHGKTGRRVYGLAFETGRRTDLIDTQLGASSQAGIEGLITRSVERKMEHCRWVGKAELVEAWERVER